MDKRINFLILLFLGFLAVSCHQHSTIEQTPFSHFQHEETIRLTLETDFKKLLLAAAEPAYQTATITLNKGGGHDEHFHVMVKPRGVFRRETCDFPPLKIRFDEEVMEAEGMAEHPSLKLVTHCRLDSAYDQLVLRENLVFKLYNVLTDSSFRTQLAHVKYVDTGGSIPGFERYGFLIENPDEMAGRMNGYILEEGHGVPGHIHNAQYKLFTMFQYMIGNTDWALKNRHNVKLVQPREGESVPPIPVPYDFDFCGFVNAPYAEPHPSIPVGDVTERYFQWRGKGEDFSEVEAIFRRKKKELMDVVENCEGLDIENQMECLVYLESFFAELEKG